MIDVKTPEDHLVCWNLSDIGRLDKFSFMADLAAPESETLTVCFWFYAARFTNKQVLANQGNKSPKEVGWSVSIENLQLSFCIKPDKAPSAEISVPMKEISSWHHFAGLIHFADGLLEVFIDGAKAGSRLLERPLQTVKPHLQQPLIIGGYTDPAGGHFDHTFGRNGSGLVDDFRIYTRGLSPGEVASFIQKETVIPDVMIKPVGNRTRQNREIQLEAICARPANCDIRAYLWEFGDGFFGEGEQVSHHYEYGGDYTVKLIAVNNAHQMSAAEHSLHLEGPAKPFRTTPVFVNGEGGHNCYRIPSIIRALNGDLVAFCEGRLEGCSDSTQTIRVVAKRSTDEGETWGPLQIVSRNIVMDKEYVIHDIAPVVDTVHNTGRMLLVYSKSEFNEWQIADGEGVVRCFCIWSDDHGFTWHEELDITDRVHKPYNPDYVHIYPGAARPENKPADWRNQRPTVGHAIQLIGTPENMSTRGRLFFVGSFIPGDAGVFSAFNYVFWSDDLGATWEIGGIVDGPREDGSSPQGLNEAIAVELENGDVLINSRNYIDKKPVGKRAITIGTFDQNGQIQFLPTYHDQALISPCVQASMIRYTRSDQSQYGNRSRILFCNPAHPKSRHNLTVRLSYNEGKTWPISKVIDPGPSAYSDLVIQDDMKIGVLYEQGNQGGIGYVSFTLDWLTDGADKFDMCDS